MSGDPAPAPPLGEDGAGPNRRIAALEIEKARLEVLVTSGQAERAAADRDHERRLAETRES